MACIDDHLLAPNISIDEYARQSQIQLGRDLSEKRAVYLDTKYWILLREANQKEEMEKAAMLLKLLRAGVSRDLLFCPISEAVFIELMKQSDTSSRLATAKLIDELSLGVTLIREEERIFTEIEYLMLSSLKRNNLQPLDDLIWCKLSYVLGFQHPTNPMFDASTDLAIQKAFFDHMCTIPLHEMVRLIGGHEFPGTNLGNIAAALNNGNDAHSDELRSFKQAYDAEAKGLVDQFGCMAVDVMMSLVREQDSAIAPSAMDERGASENWWKNLLFFALERNRARDVLRTINILASLHASLRWNKGRRYRNNDLLDFHHAAAALAYCDAFLTERSLSTMITERALDKIYQCHVAWTEDDAIAYLSRIVH